MGSHSYWRQRRATIITVAGEVGDRPMQTPGRSSANNGAVNVHSLKNTPARSSATSPYPHGAMSPIPEGVSPSPARSTPRKFFKRPFPLPSPAKHIKSSLARRFGHAKPRSRARSPKTVRRRLIGHWTRTSVTIRISGPSMNWGRRRSTSATTCGTLPWRDGTRSSSRSLLLPQISSQF